MPSGMCWRSNRGELGLFTKFEEFFRLVPVRPARVLGTGRP
jgi:hypothetical protein